MKTISLRSPLTQSLLLSLAILVVGGIAYTNISTPRVLDAVIEVSPTPHPLPEFSSDGEYPTSTPTVQNAPVKTTTQTQQTITHDSGSYDPNTPIRCEAGDSVYYLPYTECQKKINEWYDSHKVTIPTYAPTQSTYTTTIDTSRCTSQYQSDTQAANTQSGGVKEALLSQAKSNYDSCMQTGKTSTITIQQDSSPRDVQGNLCSSYDTVEAAKMMGCP